MDPDDVFQGTWLHVLRAQGTGHGTQEDQLCILCSFILTKNQGANRIKLGNGHLEYIYIYINVYLLYFCLCYLYHAGKIRL